MKAVFTTGGKQYYVSEGDVIYVEKLDAKENETVKFEEVLFVDGVAGIVVRMRDFFEHTVRKIAIHRFLPLTVDRRIIADAAGMVAHKRMDFRNGGHAAGYAVFLCHQNFGTLPGCGQRGAQSAGTCAADYNIRFSEQGQFRTAVRYPPNFVFSHFLTISRYIQVFHRPRVQRVRRQ